MKTAVVFFGLVGAALCYPWGLPQQVADTPEVAAAKAAHLAALASAGQQGTPNAWVAEPRSWNGQEDDGSWTETKYDNGARQGNDNNGDSRGESNGDGSYADDGAWKHYDDGSWRDESQHSWNQGPTGALWETHEKKWTGPVALPPGYDKNGAPLPVLDTPEVAAAKAAHLAAVGARRH